MRKKNGVLSKVNDADIKLLNKNPKKFWKGVTEIRKDAFSACTSLQSIEIPDGVTEIGVRAFYHSNLQSIEIPNSVTEIGEGAFEYCKSLQSIEIPNSVTQIGEQAFADCSNLQSIEIPNSVTEIGNDTFSGCSSLHSIEIPNSVTKIGGGAFSDCKSLWSIEIPNGVTEIGNYTFCRCSFLHSIEIPNSVTKIGDCAFVDCDWLQSIEIPNSVTKIGAQTFLGCSRLQNMDIPKSVTEIGYKALCRCSSLQSIEIPKNVTEIGYYTFGGCSSLQSIEIPNSVTKIGDGAFAGCESLQSIEIPNSVTEIGEDAFADCTSLQSIEIPNSVTKIGKGAFDRCESLQSIKLPTCDAELLGISPYSNKNLQNVQMEHLGKTYNIIAGVFLFNINLTKLDAETLRLLQDFVPMGFQNRYNDLDLKNTKAHKNVIKKLLESNVKIDPTNLYDMFSFEYNLGMFSTEKIAVKNDQGKMVEMPASDMAYNVMQKILDGGIKFDEMHMHFQSMEPKTFSPEFLKFMSQKTNLQEIISKEQADYGFITRTYEWFAEREALQNLGEIEDLASGDTLPTSEANRYKIKVYETTPSGIDKLRWREPTVELLAKEFTERRFTGITAENRHIAEYVGQWQNYDQRHFDKAVEIDQERQKLGTPDHITKTPVKQELVDAYRKYIAETDAKRQEILQTAGEVVCDQAESANNIFTYEMLAKSDEANFAMGFLTSCCATLYGAGAGAQRGMIISPDMQPLVIRDNKGNIVSFGIVYVNRKEGYAVVNDFEVNTKYSGNDEARKSIYNTAMAGVDAFAKQYNAEAKESGTAPIKMVTCGRSPNWTAINDFIDQNPQSKILEAPDFSDYKYAGSGMWPGDWHNSQRILWQNGKLVDVDQNEGGNYRG